MMDSLTSIHDLTRTSVVDPLDGPPIFRAAVGYGMMVCLARDLDVGVEDLFSKVT
jgi:origin recognition complex subunit 5